MRTNERGRNSPVRWIFAGLLFILGLTFSLTPASAFNYPYNDDSNSRGNREPDRHTNHTQHTRMDKHAIADSPEAATAVPEPTTILLLVGGLGATLWNRKRKKV